MSAKLLSFDKLYATLYTKKTMGGQHPLGGPEVEQYLNESREPRRMEGAG